MTGERIVGLSWVGTALFSFTAVLGAVVPAADLPALVVSIALFAAGTALFFVAYARAVSRSRIEQVGTMALFFLEGAVAPRRIRRLLLGSFGAEAAVALATAAVRPNTSLAFGILAPVYGLALAGVWGAYHGTFPARQG